MGDQTALPAPGGQAPSPSENFCDLCYTPLDLVVETFCPACGVTLPVLFSESRPT